MSWQLNEVPWPPTEDYKPKVGDCFRIPLDYKYPDGDTYEDNFNSHLSPEFRSSGRREAYFVYCPYSPGSASPWPVDFNASDSSNGWTVTGLFPNITVRPSINFVKSYHGWLTDGILSDDTEGRTFETP